MPATISAEYTKPSDGEKSPASIRLDLVKKRPDKNPDGSDNTDLSESIFMVVTGPAGTIPFTRHLDGHVLDSLLGIIGATPSNADADNGGTPADQLDIEGICGVIAQLERPSIPTDVAAVYTAEVTADTDVTEDPGNAGDDSVGTSGTFSGSVDADWDLVVTTGGTFDGAAGKVTLYEAGTTDVVKSEWAPTSGVGDLVTGTGVTITITDGGDTNLVGNDKWLIENTADVAEGVLVTWVDSPDIAAKFYKVAVLTGADWGTEVVVDECDVPGDGGSGALLAPGAQLLNVESLNAIPDDYKFVVYATMAASSTDQLGTYNQSLRSVPSNTVTVV